MTIGEIICELRKEQNLSQKKLADAVGVSQAAIAKIEINRNEATASTIRKLSAFFGVSADYLLNLEDDFGTRTSAPMKIASLSSNNYSDEERRIIEEYRKLPESSKQLFRRMAGITDTVIKN